MVGLENNNFQNERKRDNLLSDFPESLELENSGGDVLLVNLKNKNKEHGKSRHGNRADRRRV